MTQPPRARSAGAIAAVGVTALVALALAIAAVVRWRAQQEQARQADRAEQTFGPVVATLRKAAVEPPAPYDIDATMRALHEVDLALTKGGDLSSWLSVLARPDHRRVPAEVLAARAELIALLQRLYALQVEEADREDFARVARALALQGLASLRVDTSVSGAGVAFDGQRMQAAVDQVVGGLDRQVELKREILAMRAELVGALARAAQATHKYVDEWDRLVLLRDRAYLAAVAGDWQRAADAARQAIDRAPFDREGHLLYALAATEAGLRHDGEVGGGGPAPRQVLQAYLDAHPGESAPALLLLGNLEARQGRHSEARLLYEQAAAYYPNQAERLHDMVDPYRARTYLRKSREGNVILDQYRSLSLGAGAFSPDLRLARLLYAQGDDAGGRAKIMDHFSRRRAQRDWSALVADIRVARELLGAHYDRIFPEEAYLDLIAEPAVFGSKLKVSVRNRSARSLHNATLVLCLHLTDMHPDDFEALPAVTKPVVAAHLTTRFEDVAVAVELWGTTKTADHVVAVRAILVSDEVVAWVDTETFKLAEDQALAEARRARADPPPPSPTAAAAGRQAWARITGMTPERVEALVRAAFAAAVDTGLGDDDLVITLPAEIAILRPSVRLRHGGRDLAAEEHTIADGAIRLTFKDVANFDDAAASRDFELLVSSRMLSFAVAVGPDAAGALAVKRFELR